MKWRPKSKKLVNEFTLDAILGSGITENVIHDERLQVYRYNFNTRMGESLDNYIVHCRYLESLGCIEFDYIRDVNEDICGVSINVLPHGYRVQLDGGFVGKYFEDEARKKYEKKNIRITRIIAIAALIISIAMPIYTNVIATAETANINNMNTITKDKNPDMNTIRSSSQSFKRAEACDSPYSTSIAKDSSAIDNGM